MWHMPQSYVAHAPKCVAHPQAYASDFGTCVTSSHNFVVCVTYCSSEACFMHSVACAPHFGACGIHLQRRMIMSLTFVLSDVVEDKFYYI